MNEEITQPQPEPIQLRYAPQFKGDGADLIFEFFMVFSRFEYSLKKAGYYQTRGRGNNKRVEPNWESFISSVKTSFDPNQSSELLDAYNYYLTSAPRIQSVEDDVLIWLPNVPKEKENLFHWVVCSVKTARNNLFHGGKFPYEQVRDTAVLKNGLVILYKLLELDDKVHQAFFSSDRPGLPGYDNSI